MSLKVSDRVGEIVAEKELEKLQDEELADGDKADKEDPILDETLNIVADLLQIGGKIPEVLITKTDN